MDSAAASPGRANGVAAFFDVDNTIIRGGSAFHIARGLHRRGYLRNGAILRFAWQQVKYQLFGEKATQFDQIRTEALSIIKGWSVAEMTSIGEEVYDEVITHRIFPGTKGLLDAHLARGHEVWLITASPVEVGRIIARRLGATGALGTLAEHSRGYYTGALIGDMLHGEAKATAARSLAAERGLSLEDSFAYGDSTNDIPILRSVGFPCAINPERRLRRFARRNGWAIRDFRGKKSNGRRGLMAATGAGALWVVIIILRGLTAPIRGIFRRLLWWRRR
ncbi:MAG: HAD-IB family hydrolase [Demequinaceae bacterium]|nr:HAD-IB family hydrolase [Demequinaceae bacterium]